MTDNIPQDTVPADTPIVLPTDTEIRAESLTAFGVPLGTLGGLVAGSVPQEPLSTEPLGEVVPTDVAVTGIADATGDPTPTTPARRERERTPVVLVGWRRVPDTETYALYVAGEPTTVVSVAELTAFEKANHGQLRGLKSGARLDRLVAERSGTTTVVADPSSLVDDSPGAVLGKYPTFQGAESGEWERAPEAFKGWKEFPAGKEVQAEPPAAEPPAA